MKKLLLIGILFSAMQTMAQNGRGRERNNRYNKINNSNKYKFPSKFSTTAGTIYNAGDLVVDRHYLSSDNSYFFVFQSDGNLVIYRSSDNTPHWSASTTGLGATRATFQKDGNLVLTNAAGGIVWDAISAQSQRTGVAITENATARRARGSRNALVMQPDGNLVIYNKTGTVKWAAFI